MGSLQGACAEIPLLTTSTQDLHARITSFILEAQQQAAQLAAGVDPATASTGALAPYPMGAGMVAAPPAPFLQVRGLVCTVREGLGGRKRFSLGERCFPGHGTMKTSGSFYKTPEATCAPSPHASCSQGRPTSTFSRPGTAMSGGLGFGLGMGMGAGQGQPQGVNTSATFGSTTMGGCGAGAGVHAVPQLECSFLEAPGRLLPTGPGHLHGPVINRRNCCLMHIIEPAAVHTCSCCTTNVHDTLVYLCCTTVPQPPRTRRRWRWRSRAPWCRPWRCRRGLRSCSSRWRRWSKT